MLTVSTINVNGLRAAAKKGYLSWLASSSADVVCLQEVRAEPSELPAEVHSPPGWHGVYAHSSLKGRAGVAILSRVEPSSVRVGFGASEFESSGRYVEIELPDVVVGSLYLPSGDVGTEKQDEKDRFMAAFLPYLVSLREKAAVSGREVLVCGDWNIAHRAEDLKAWKTNQKSSGFLPYEREWMSSVFSSGYTDVMRALHPDAVGPYSWWSYRGKAFDNDSGWRIDLVVTTDRIAQTATSAVVERAASYQERWSDHAPVTVTFDWPKP
ncbi:exodeoxyribonuclease III [Lentzea guizhouensis]|uniref:Exodeoxyribonuclease III n=1 Tax=Lentzea guizhouensis TaxID=1586287 RepID=A0A1B2HJ29_9PSEU|nr:exodeoxyribonuclease III [Lentzea guizhouensis]ANZ37738.1 exodeoxyribonuclease III [Lentzea guizhouensis]